MPISDKDVTVGKQTAQAFWKTLSTGDVDKFERYYAWEGVLKSGSELLKDKRRLIGDHRQADHIIKKKELLTAYRKMIA